MLDLGGKPSFLLDHLGGAFRLLAVGDVAVPASDLPVLRVGPGGLQDVDGHVAARYGVGRLYLVRPDQHVAARFVEPTTMSVRTALARAKASSPSSVEVA